MRKYSVIDLFAGAGGLSYGFTQTGRFRIAAAAEINENARKTYKKNIAQDNPEFPFVENVIGCDFAAINRKVGGIDIVIGGPPCQGFSNANRQKNTIMSLNNSLVKEYFRAIKQIHPLAFVMENVSMLRSDVHRFYESRKDNSEIEELILQGHNIPKRLDQIVVADRPFKGIDFENVENIPISDCYLPQNLLQLLSVLLKNINNPRRLPNYIKKNKKALSTNIDSYIESITTPTTAQQDIIDKLTAIRGALDSDEIHLCESDLKLVMQLQKMLTTISEINQNDLIGQYRSTDSGALYFDVYSYSVIDYINAILGNEYKQAGDVICAEWFGVPQERRRYIIIGIRNDLFQKDKISLPVPPQELHTVTVEEAISDLAQYPACYEKEHALIPYEKNDVLSEYAIKMRQGSEGVRNHISTKTTKTALDRFRAIKQGDNFHSLDTTLKSTYSKPERTQNTIYLRLDPKKPSGTVVNVRKSMWIHPTLDRAITVREAARLQSFPDAYVFIGSKDSQYQQVGNAVPPLLAKAIAEKVLENIE